MNGATGCTGAGWPRRHDGQITVGAPCQCALCFHSGKPQRQFASVDLVENLCVRLAVLVRLRPGATCSWVRPPRLVEPERKVLVPPIRLLLGAAVHQSFGQPVSTQSAQRSHVIDGVRLQGRQPSSHQLILIY